VAVGAGPAAVTQLGAAAGVAVVVAEAVVARSTELRAAGAVEVVVADGTVAVPDDWQQSRRRP